MSAHRREALQVNLDPSNTENLCPAIGAAINCGASGFFSRWRAAGTIAKSSPAYDNDRERRDLRSPEALSLSARVCRRCCDYEYKLQHDLLNAKPLRDHQFFVRFRLAVSEYRHRRAILQEGLGRMSCMDGIACQTDPRQDLRHITCHVRML